MLISTAIFFPDMSAIDINFIESLASSLKNLFKYLIPIMSCLCSFTPTKLLKLNFILFT